MALCFVQFIFFPDWGLICINSWSHWEELKFTMYSRHIMIHHMMSGKHIWSLLIKGSQLLVSSIWSWLVVSHSVNFVLSFTWCEQGHCTKIVCLCIIEVIIFVSIWMFILRSQFDYGIILYAICSFFVLGYVYNCVPGAILESGGSYCEKSILHHTLPYDEGQALGTSCN